MNRLALPLALFAAMACSSGADPIAQVPTEAPAIAGTITNVTGDRIRVEAVPSDSSGSPKAVARILDSTVVLRRNGAAFPAESLRAGHRVSAWTTGPVMESYPIQFGATTVVVEPDSAR